MSAVAGLFIKPVAVAVAVAVVVPAAGGDNILVLQANDLPHGRRIGLFGIHQDDLLHLARASGIQAAGNIQSKLY